MDDESVRAAFAAARGAGGEPLLAAAEIARVIVDGSWVCVDLAREAPSRAFLTAVHGVMRSEFPGAEVEVRAGTRIHRGGAGFGKGRHLIAVLGGKGGVGKSTMNLALTLSAMGLSTGLVDADLNAPDIPHVMGAHPGPRTRQGGWRNTEGHPLPPASRSKPTTWYGVEVMSAGFLLPERFPPMLTSRLLISTLLRQLVFDVDWRAEIVLLDAPPGTGEELQVMTRELPLSGALFVTTPQDLAQMDAQRTLTLLNDHGVPVVGLVYNMASLSCPHCEREIDLYAQSRRLQDTGVPMLGRVPFDVRLSEAVDRGCPLVLGDPRGPVAYEFARIGSALRRWLRDREGAERAA
jgi:ATP-binding protein involved in chromosome partitioning